MRHDEPATKADLGQLKRELVAKIDANGAKIDQVEQSLTAKIDANSAKIDANSAKIEANGKKIDANSVKIDANGAKIDQVEQRLTARLDRLTDYAIENRERVGKMLTEERFKVYFSEIMSNIHGIAKSVFRGEQERTAMNARLGRVEEAVGTNKADIEKIKTKLAMP